MNAGEGAVIGLDARIATLERRVRRLQAALAIRAQPAIEGRTLAGATRSRLPR